METESLSLRIDDTSIENVIFFGTRHFSRDTREVEKKFRNELTKCDYLLLEGAKKQLEVASLLNLRGFETIAFKENVPKYFLENDYKIEKIVQKYGLRSDLYSLLDSLHLLKPEYDIPRKVLDNIDSHFNTKLLVGDSITNPDKEKADLYKTIRIFQRDDFHDKFQFLNHFSNELLSYVASIRDYEIMGPNIRNLIDSLEGKKGIIVGKAHVNNLIDCFYDRMKKPVDFNNYLSTFPKQYKETIDIINKEILNN